MGYKTCTEVKGLGILLRAVTSLGGAFNSKKNFNTHIIKKSFWICVRYAGGDYLWSAVQDHLGLKDHREDIQAPGQDTALAELQRCLQGWPVFCTGFFLQESVERLQMNKVATVGSALFCCFHVYLRGLSLL